MSKIFSVNFNKNSVLDEFGATATLGSTAKLVKDEKGMALNCTTQITDYINYGDIAAINNIGTGQFSFVVSTNIRRFLNHGSVYNSLFGKTDNFGTSGFGMMYPDSNSIFVRILNTTINVPSFDITGNHIFVFTRNSAGLCSIFIDGVLKGTPATQAGSISSTAVLAIGHEGVATTSNRTPDAIIYGASVYNHCLSQQEINKL